MRRPGRGDAAVVAAGAVGEPPRRGGAVMEGLRVRVAGLAAAERLVVRRVAGRAGGGADRRGAVVDDLAVAAGVGAGERVRVGDLRGARARPADVAGGAAAARPVHALVAGGAVGAVDGVAGGGRGDAAVVAAGAGGRRAVDRVVMRTLARRRRTGANAVALDAGLAIPGRAVVDRRRVRVRGDVRGLARGSGRDMARGRAARGELPGRGSLAGLVAVPALLGAPSSEACVTAGAGSVGGRRVGVAAGGARTLGSGRRMRPSRCRPRREPRRPGGRWRR